MEISVSVKGTFSSFRYRDFRLLWSGAFLSNVGTWIHNTALLWFVRETTGSNTWVGAVNMAWFLPVLVLVLWAGSLADRLDRRRLILATQTAMMLLAFAMGLSLQLRFTSMAVIIPLSTGMGMAFVFNFPAWRALIPDLVPREQMLNGIALDAAQFNLARSVGPLLGALILSAWGAETAFHINAASFLAVILALLAMHTKTPAAAVSGSTGKHIGEGMRVAFGESWSRNLLALLATFSFFGLSFLVLLPGMSREVLGRGSEGYGALLSAIGVGAVAGAPLVSFLRRRLRENTIMKATSTLFGLSLLAVAFCRDLWICLLLAFFIGTTSLMLSAAINTVLQARVAREMRGRIMSLYILVFQGIYPLGGMFLAYLADATSIPATLMVGGGVCTAAGIMVAAFPSLLRDAVSEGAASSREERGRA